MTWQITSEDVLSGEGVKTFAQNLYDRDANSMGFGNTWNYTGVEIGTPDVWEEMGATHILMPAFVRTNDILKVTVYSRGETSDQIRIYDKTGSVAGTAVDVTDTSDARYEMTFTLTGAWASTVREFSVQGYQDGVESAVPLRTHCAHLMANVSWGSGA